MVTGTGANQFSGTAGFTSLRVQNTAVSSPPNALAVALHGGGSAYVYKQYASAHTHYHLTFNLQLGADFSLDDSSDYVNVAQTVPSTTSNVGKVTVVLPADNRLRLDYFDSAGQQHYLWGSYAVPTGSWHKVELRETMGAGSGSLALLVDGTTVSSGSTLDLGPQGLTWFAVGERYSPPDSETAGHLYIDDVAAADPAAPATAPATAPVSSAAIPIPAASATPGAARILPLARQLSPHASAQRLHLLQRHQRQRGVLHSAREELLRSTHRATLRTLAQIYRVRPLLGHTQNATALGDLFATFP
jgi:hypothetical protein